jgi:hypothetical protein
MLPACSLQPWGMLLLSQPNRTRGWLLNSFAITSAQQKALLVNMASGVMWHGFHVLDAMSEGPHACQLTTLLS